MKILMASTNYWTSPVQVGSHQIARAFARRGCQVAYISDPISPFHVFNGKDASLCQRLDIYRQNGIRDCNQNLWAYVPGAFFTPHTKPLLRSDFVARYWQRLTLPDIVTMVKKEGFGDVDWLYMDSIAQSFWLDSISYRKSVFRINDRLSGFPKVPQSMYQIEAEIAQRADLTIYTARNLESHVRSLQPRHCEYFPNGVNFLHFNNGSRELPQEYRNIKKPIVIYVGVMDVWFDYELIIQAARQLPSVSFVLIGPDKLARQRLRQSPNLFLLGPRSYQDLPGYLHNADLGIIPFDVVNHGKLIHAVHPLKLYEYTACGLPVVSTMWDEMSVLQSPAVLCPTNQEFIQAIERMLNNPGNQDNYIEFARQYDWDTLVERLFRMVEDRL